MSDVTIVIKPTHYTSYEGGIWKLWPFNASIKAKALDEALEYCKITGESWFYLSSMRIHSLAFIEYNQRTNSMGNYARWDCINGWTTTLEEIEELSKSDR